MKTSITEEMKFRHKVVEYAIKMVFILYERATRCSQNRK